MDRKVTISGLMDTVDEAKGVPRKRKKTRQDRERIRRIGIKALKSTLNALGFPVGR